ncbi:MAG TPA: LysR substrate-binding domain-containing protein [Gemmatimonadales bacterium]|nr:LysR substrate-binding domain-containing protein [Gemmatimonadales bacterium]
MLDLNDFSYFVQVVDRGGFTAAGRELRIPKSTLSHRLQELERSLGVRLLNRTSRRFGMTDAGIEFYRHAAAALREAELAEWAMRNRLTEPSGTVRCTASIATMQFAISEVVSSFLVKHPKVIVVAHATNQLVDLVGERYDIAIRAHSGPLPDSTLVQQTLAPAPWFLFAGSAYLDAHRMPEKPRDLSQHPSLFMMRSGVDPIWRLRQSGARSKEVTVQLTPRFVSDDMKSLKRAAVAGLGIVALPGYVCREDLRSGSLRRVLPDWKAEDSTLTALMPNRHGVLPSVRAFVNHLAAELPKAVAL